MKYVTLEHRLTLPYGTIGCHYARFDTNDTVFETEARELEYQRYSKLETVKNQIIEEINRVVNQAQENKKDLDELRKNTPILKRLFSKDYKTKRKCLQKQYQECRSQHLKLIKESNHIGDNVLSSFDTYNDLNRLLKNSGYALVSKTTNDRYATTEIWHKND